MLSTPPLIGQAVSSTLGAPWASALARNSATLHVLIKEPASRQHARHVRGHGAPRAVALGPDVRVTSAPFLLGHRGVTGGRVDDGHVPEHADPHVVGAEMAKRPWTGGEGEGLSRVHHPNLREAAE